ncbi:MAG TPA: YggS family pyridoxal phosphate-dependent enzyme [Chitinophagaceae bacterium]|nr:YggS family pyridoxal phosphate-dependent enzyme [Chitinophagaceae bacterium]
MSNALSQNYHTIINELKAVNVNLVAVSKMQSVEVIKKLYQLGQRDFGENYVQELIEKQRSLPADIRWHFIGHLQTNKVKFIASFIYLIQGVDSFKLLKEINKEAKKNDRTINVLLQVHIAKEESKFGLDANELNDLLVNQIPGGPLQHVNIMGLMGMASFTNHLEKVREEFKYLKTLYNKYSQLSTDNCQLQTLSMGMSGDYKIAIEEGSNMVRIGSLIFGPRH